MTMEKRNTVDIKQLTEREIRDIFIQKLIDLRWAQEELSSKDNNLTEIIIRANKDILLQDGKMFCKKGDIINYDNVFLNTKIFKEQVRARDKIVGPDEDVYQLPQEMLSWVEQFEEDLHIGKLSLVPKPKHLPKDLKDKAIAEFEK